jgi:serine protease Do
MLDKDSNNLNTDFQNDNHLNTPQHNNQDLNNQAQYIYNIEVKAEDQVQDNISSIEQLQGADNSGYTSSDNITSSTQAQTNDTVYSQVQNTTNWDNQSQNTSYFINGVNQQFQNQLNYKESIVKPENKRRHTLLTYMSLVLVTSVITSFVVGGALYTSFSKQLSNIQNNVSSTGGLVQTSSVGDNISGTNLVASTNLKDLTVTEIAKKVGPSIVGIKMTFKTNTRGFFFGSSIPSTSDAEGSGIIISSDGYIMTNYHVVEYADPNSNIKNTTLTVYLPDKREATARFIGGDSDNDLALIKIDLANLPVAELGDSSSVEVGDLAVAIGNPLGMEFAGSVTSGVISALNRQLKTGNMSLNLIQTDAAINPGNSGGALLNSKGQVIGINSAKISVSGVEGLGFAIPINTAKPIIEQLKTYGYVKGKPLVGISGQEVSQDISDMYGIPVGIYVVEVPTDGAAYAAGIKKGDVLVKLDGKEIKTMSDIDAVKKLHKAGDTVDAVVIRGDKTLTLKLTFTEDK